MRDVGNEAAVARPIQRVLQVLRLHFARFELEFFHCLADQVEFINNYERLREFETILFL